MVVGDGPSTVGRIGDGRGAQLRAARWRAALGLAWVAASGCRSVLPLLHDLSPEEIWTASRRRLVDAGLAWAAADRFLQRRGACRLETVVAATRAVGDPTVFLPYGDPGYPGELLQLPAPPPGLFVAGDRGAWNRVDSGPRITIVGTRRASSYGLHVADVVAERFARAGVAVLSGLALGIDGRSHESALRARGLTVAVVGNGTDLAYPRRHRGLRRQVLARGCVVGELPPGTAPSRWTFPLRNRLLAALGDAVIVVEAGVRSGALITAEVAAELGRPVFAVPGYILADAHLGCNRLLYDGATPLLDPDEALEDFLRLTRMERGARRATLAPGGGSEAATGGADGLESRILAALAAGPLGADDLIAGADTGVGEVSRALALLELRGLVVRADTGRYRQI